MSSLPTTTDWRRSVRILVRLCVAVLALAGPVQADEATPDRPASQRQAIVLPAREPAKLKLLAKLGPGPGKEISGIVGSRTQDNCFWTLNDSGNEPRVYAIQRNGADHRPGGVLLEGASNVDWEDIAVDADGRLIVADLGNNANNRRDLTLYYLQEPAATANRTAVAQKLLVRYPDQSEFPSPPTNLNFDCEAVFTVGNIVHLLSKNRSDRFTTMYRLDDPKPDVTNVLTKVDTFEIGGMVTAADASPDGKRLVVITYQAVWLFERTDAGQNFFDGKVSWAPYVSAQVESVCFADERTLLLADELLGTLYELPLSALTVVRAKSGAGP